MTDTPKSLQRNAATALFYTAALLTTYEYWLLPPRAEALLQGKPIGRWALPPSLQAGLIWAIACLVGYMVLPVLWVSLQHRRWGALRELGFSARGFLKHLRVYLGLYALMVPVIYIASLSPHFTAIYPFIPAAKQSL